MTLPDGSQVALSPGGQNPLIQAIIEHFCPAFAPGGTVIYIGDTENKFNGERFLGAYSDVTPKATPSSVKSKENPRRKNEAKGPTDSKLCP